KTNATSGVMRRDSLKMLRTLDVRSRAIANNRRRRKFHRGRVIVAIRKGSEYRSIRTYWTYSSISAASGSPLAATLFQPLKIVVEHSSVTNQAHLFRQLDVGRPDQSATPGTDDVVHGWLFMVLRMDTFIQFNLP